MNRNILTLDIGTTSVKTCIFDERFHVLAQSNEEYELLAPGNGLIELEPEKYWDAVKSGIHEACGKAGPAAAQIRAVAVTTQGETLIPVDRGGRPLCNAVVWLDSRAGEESRLISERFPAAEFYRKTGLPECTGLCPVSKLLWFRLHRPEIYQAAYKFMLLEDFIILRLTGRFVSEKSLLSSTGYFNLERDGLWREILDAIGVDGGKIPEPLECGTVVSGITPQAAGETGLPAETVVVTSAMDQTAGAVGAGNLFPGVVTETTGTALVIAAASARPDFSDPSRVTVYRHVRQGLFLYVPVCMTAGIVLKWFKDEFCRDLIGKYGNDGVYAALSTMAEGVPPLSNGLVLLPYFAGVVQPDNNPLARGVFFGMGLDTKREHFIRAIMESVAFLMEENVELLESITGEKITKIRSLGGGSKSPVWLQIKADVSGRRIARMSENECTSLGAAILAGKACGFVPDAVKASGTANTERRVFVPDPSVTERYREGYRTYRELYERVKPLFRKH